MQESPDPNLSGLRITINVIRSAKALRFFTCKNLFLPPSVSISLRVKSQSYQYMK